MLAPYSIARQAPLIGDVPLFCPMEKRRLGIGDKRAKNEEKSDSIVRALTSWLLKSHKSMHITSKKNKIQNCLPSLIIIREKETLGG